MTADLPLWFLSPVRFLESIRLQVQGKWRAAFSLLLPHRPLQPWSSIGVCFSGTSPSLQLGPTLWPVNERNEGRNSFLPRKTLGLMFCYNSLCRSDDRKKCHQCQGEQCHTQTHLAREDHRAGGFVGGGSESERVGDYFPPEAGVANIPEVARHSCPPQLSLADWSCRCQLSQTMYPSLRKEEASVLLS